MEEQRNRFQSPGAITAAVPVGLFFDPEHASREEIQRLGAEAIAITHGNPLAFLAGAALAHIISRLCWDGQKRLKPVVEEAVAMLRERFGRDYRQAEEVCRELERAVELAASHDIGEAEAMEQLDCDTAAKALAGAVYACLCHPTNFDEAMITAVNHSGYSAAVGAVAGAILGASLGYEGLPEFYLECLEPAEVLTELAKDMFQGCPMSGMSGLFDIEWDDKYISFGI
jgi:ADP-ribosylglycohydrolase